MILYLPTHCDVKDKYICFVTSYLYRRGENILFLIADNWLSLYFLGSLTSLEAMQGMYESFLIRTLLVLVSVYCIKTSGKRNLFVWFVLFMTACNYAYSCVFNSVLEICLIKSPWVPDVVQRYNSQLLFFTVDLLYTIIPHTSRILSLVSAIIYELMIRVKTIET